MALGSLLLALLLLFAAPGAASAAAAPSTHKLIWGPYDEKAFDTYADLGAGLYEFTINWSLIAPTKPEHPTDPHDPAYEWTPAVEEMIEHANEHGIQVVLEVTGAPGWANGGKPWRWAPHNPEDYAEFISAASKRWPQIHYWQVWGEPVRRENWMPLPSVEGLTLTRAQRRAPERYAQLLDDSYESLKQVDPSNIVIGGNTYSGGDIRPLTFIKYLKLPNGKPPRMDMFGHNPFGYRRPDLAKGPINPKSGIADFCDLDLVASYLDKYLSRDGRDRRLPLFLSEYFLPTDHANPEFGYWVSKQTAASWLRSAFDIEDSWNRIYTLGWFALEDDKPNGHGNQVNRGLLTYKGVKKPAYYAFKQG